MLVQFMVKIFGPNWKTTVTAIGTAIASLMTILAALPQDSGLQMLPEPYRTYIIKAGILSAFVLKILNGMCSKDANPSVPDHPRDDKKL